MIVLVVLLSSVLFWGLFQLCWGTFLFVLHSLDLGLRAERFAAGPDKSRVAIVLVHGFADTPKAWQRQADCLAERGFAVLVPALKMNGTAGTWEAAVRDAVAEARERADRVWVWAHSMGCPVTLAAQAGADGLVLWAPFFEPWLGRAPAKALLLAYRLLFPWGYTPTWFPALRTPRGGDGAPYRVRRIIPVRTFRAMLSEPARALAAPQPECPVAVLVSSRDTVVRNAASRRALPKADFMRASDPMSGHALTNAADWRINLGRALTFMRYHGAA